MHSDDYYSVRSQIQKGDIVLIQRRSFISSCIRYFDNAYWTHVGIVHEMGDRLITIDMWNRGIELVPLSRRINDSEEFRIYRPVTSKQAIDKAITNIINIWERDRNYDYWLLLRIAIFKKTGIDLAGLGSKKRNVCSELVQEYTESIGLDCYRSVDLITPEDFVRYADDLQIQLIVP